MSERGSQAVSLIGTIDPAGGTAGTVTTDTVDASLYDSVVFMFLVGNVCSCSGKIIFTIYEGTASATVSTTVDKTTWTASSTGDNNFQYTMEVDTSIMGGNNYRYLKGNAVYSGGTGRELAAVVLGVKPRYHPGSDSDLASNTIVFCT